MDTSILSTYDISIDIEEIILEAFNELKNLSLIEFDPEFVFDISQYSAFYRNELNYFGPVIKVNRSEIAFHICFIELRLSQMRKSTSISLDYQNWGVLRLKKNYPHILIRTETFIDKMHELINPIELDFFDDKEFSRKFFVLTEDKQKAELALNSAFRKAILEVEETEIVIEIRESQLLIGNEKSLDQAFILDIYRFLSKLSKSH